MFNMTRFSELFAMATTDARLHASVMAHTSAGLAPTTRDGKISAEIAAALLRCETTPDVSIQHSVVVHRAQLRALVAPRDNNAATALHVAVPGTELVQGAWEIFDYYGRIGRDLKEVFDHAVTGLSTLSQAWRGNAANATPISVAIKMAGTWYGSVSLAGPAYYTHTRSGTTARPHDRTTAQSKNVTPPPHGQCTTT